MNIESLLDLACATVANMIKGKTPEEIRKTFNIVVSNLLVSQHCQRTCLYADCSLYDHSYNINSDDGFKTLQTYMKTT